MNTRINEIKAAVSLLTEVYSTPLAEESKRKLEEEILNELIPLSHSNVIQTNTQQEYELPPKDIKELPYNHPGRVLVSTRVQALGHLPTRSNITKAAIHVVDTFLKTYGHYPPREICENIRRVTYVYLTRDIPLIDSVIKQVL